MPQDREGSYWPSMFDLPLSGRRPGAPENDAVEDAAGSQDSHLARQVRQLTEQVNQLHRALMGEDKAPAPAAGDGGVAAPAFASPSPFAPAPQAPEAPPDRRAAPAPQTAPRRDPAPVPMPRPAMPQAQRVREAVEAHQAKIDEEVQRLYPERAERQDVARDRQQAEADFARLTRNVDDPAERERIGRSLLDKHHLTERGERAPASPGAAGAASAPASGGGSDGQGDVQAILRLVEDLPRRLMDMLTTG